MPKIISFEVYGKDPCGYCTATKDLLRKKGETFSYRDVGNMEPEDIMTFMGDAQGHKTFPFIFMTTSQEGLSERVFIGGFDQLKAHYNIP